MTITKQSIKHCCTDLCKGAVIGGSMLIPGLSGGTMAIILGVYDRLTEAAGNITKTPKKSLRCLLPFAAGGLTGAALLSGAVLRLIELYGTLSMFFFIGAIAGTVPLLVKKSGISTRNLYNAAFALLGTSAAVGVQLIPQSAVGEGGFLLTALCGFIIAAGMVLPGISTSQLLLVLGMYERVWGSLRHPDILFLLPLTVGGVIGTIVTARLTDSAIKKYPCAAYMMITGFVMSSVYDIFPKNINRQAVPLYILMCIGGFITVYIITRFAEK